MSCGIYILYFSDTHKVYVGKSSNIESRYQNHCAKLVEGTHSRKMNLAYKLYGIPKLEIECICDKADLLSKEAYYISLWNSVLDGFNTLPDGYSMPDGSMTPGELHGGAIYSNKQVLEVAEMIAYRTDLSLKDISNITEVNYNVVNNIASSASHTWIQCTNPDLYNELQRVKGLRKRTSQCAKSKGIIYPKVLSPTGVVYNIDNVTEFAKSNGLSRSNFNKLLNGHRNSCNGWKLQKA